jgi:hypothetical protein
MKIKSDSLYSRMGKAFRDAFFPWFMTENPSYRDMAAWFADRGVATSDGAVWTLVNRHIATWKLERALEAGDEEAAALPEGADEVIRERVRALKFDLVLSDLTAQQKLAYLSHDLKERELAEKKRTAREAAVDALLEEAGGDPAAAELLKRFLAAVDAKRAAGRGGGDAAAREGAA